MKFTIEYYKEAYGWLAVCKEEPDIQVRAESEEAATQRMREALEAHVAALIANCAEAAEQGGPNAEALENKLKAMEMSVKLRLEDTAE
jgi:predicted RNase H-like HicB family nuclease